MDLSVLELEVVDRVAVIRMNAPPLNALTTVFLEDFETVLDRLSQPGEARAMVLTSAFDGFFSAGDDVSSLQEIDESLLEALPRAHALLDAIEDLAVPTVAAINGHALGGGLELALVCDFRFMGAEAGRIGLPEVRLGMIPALGGTQRLPEVVGKAKAIELMVKGLQLEPEQAKAVGLVHDVFPQSDLYARSLDYATRLSRQATGAIGRIKRCVNVGLRHGFDAGMKAEAEAFRENIVGADAREGVDAFLNGRKPQFKG